MNAFFRSAFSSITSWLAVRRLRPGPPTIPQDKTGLLVETGQMIASGVFARLDLDTFLQQIADKLEHSLPAIDHVQLYVVERADQRVVLRAAAGPAGPKLLERGYETEIGDLSAVGRVTLTQSDVLIQDFNQEKIHRPHPLLSEMRSELVIPLVVKDRAVGALALQSTQPDIFSPTETAFLHAIASQITLAIDNLQLYEEAQRNLRENQALFQQTQSNLREIERLNYQLTGRAWREYLRLQSDAAALTLDLDSGQTMAEAPWTDTLKEAAARRQVITTVHKNQRTVALPIMVRNEVIGAMEFELEPEQALPDGALALIEAVGQRLGLAMETRRLFDETQRAIQRESLINDIGADLQAATGVDAIIQRAAQHLHDALEARQVAIRLGVPSDHSRRKG